MGNRKGDQVGSPRIVMVTGKGGVGKSLAATSLALAYARQGLKTLCVEFGDSSYFRDFFSEDRVGFLPFQVDPKTPNYWIACWNGHDCLKDYVRHILRLQSLADLFFENPAMKAFIGAAPALSDVALLGKLTSQERAVGPSMDFDVIVVDCYATGHFRAMLNAPKGLSAAIEKGPMGSHSRKIEEVLCSSGHVEYLIVSLAEEMPVIESVELAKSLKRDWNLKARFVLNRVLPSFREEKPLPKEYETFEDYIMSIHERQNSAREDLSRQGEILCELPMIFQSDGWQQVNELASHWDSYVES